MWYPRAREPDPMDTRTQTGSRSDDANDDPVDDIVAACLDSSPADIDQAIEVACRVHPSHSQQIRERIAALRRAGLVERAAAMAGEPFPGRLGDFVLLDRIGGGGMGIVYRARQQSLGREVALKLIRPENLYFPKARERFRRETEAVARLQHPGIVPIFTVGEEDGLPYFAMELVVGATLAEVIRAQHGRAPESLEGRDLAQIFRGQSPAVIEQVTSTFSGTWVQNVVRIAIQVAEALHHAHERGVLHRDIKPSNVVLTLDGRARLLDFGLATTREDAGNVTATGATIGTLFYMSPEHVAGAIDRIDERSDVYALGVTLYELLTLQVPFCEANAIQTRQAIVEGRADPIRARNRAVPKDLEVVCLTAMERDPARRYPNAAAFARDLGNVLELRPIEARSPSAALRARRWVQRNPAFATAAALGLIVAIGAPLAGYFVQRAYARELEVALEDARLARGQAVASERVALDQSEQARLAALDSDAIAEFLSDLFRAVDTADARASDLRARDLLDNGARRLEVELADQPGVRHRLRMRIATSYASLGAFDRARELFEESVRESVELYGENSSESAEAYYGLATTLRSTSALEALEWIEKATRIASALPERSIDRDVRYAVCLAGILTGLKRYPEALESYDLAYATLGSFEGDARKLTELVLSGRAHALFASRDYEAAAANASEALRLQTELYSDAHPGTLASLNTLALSLKSLGRASEAEPVFDEILRVGELVHGNRSPIFAAFVANRGALLEDLGRREESAAALERAWEIFEAESPPTFGARLACCTNLAGVHLRLAHFERARELYEHAATLFAQVDGEASTRVAIVLKNLAACHEARGHFAAAREALQEGLRFSEGQTDFNLPSRQARLRANLARIAIRQGDLEFARELLESIAPPAGATAPPAESSEENARTYARALLASSVGDRATAESLLRELQGPVKLEDDVRWISAAAKARWAYQRADRELAELALLELEQLVGTSHIETLDAMQFALELAERDSDTQRARELREQLQTRRKPR